ncbi:uncharacterized protein BX663DRAFT_442598 [Cokeromyces recurvatus]|uniref:uncharacterized protein n=1 Tax=Cokeromyces recurvatus TaxID=90255 RepID=UPI00221EF624|nr:uncharacterized protein BX663DRAFT_442598 [Cokeromyces recurvatus]KAI7898687.1 hypothetical protein BX663DRAFT_442598 [Cokeromyces recurvatus]
MEPHSIPSLLTAPNKTLIASSSNSRRPSNTNVNDTNSDILSRSPSLELSDSFSVLSFTPIKQHPTNNNNLKTSPTIEQHYHPFFSSSQLAFIKPICSNRVIDNWNFLSLEKYSASHNSQDAYDLEMSTLGLSIELGNLL